MVIGQRFVKLIGCWFIYRLLPRRALKVTMSSKSTPYLPVPICTWYLWCKSANSWTRCYFLTTIRIFLFWSYFHRMLSVISKLTRFKVFPTWDYQIWCFLAPQSWQPLLSHLLCRTINIIGIFHPVLLDRWIQTQNSNLSKYCFLLSSKLFNFDVFAVFYVYSISSCVEGSNKRAC